MPSQSETRVSRRAFIGGMLGVGMAGGATYFGLTKVAEMFSGSSKAATGGPGPTEAPTPAPTAAATPTEAPKPSPTAGPRTLDACPPGGFPPEDAKLSDQVSSAIQVPGNISEVQFAQLNASSPQRKWFHPIYDQSRANEANKWVGIGAHAPIYIDGDAATLQTHNNPGEFIIRQKSGGRVTVGVMQLNNHQNETKFSSETGVAVQNSDWTNQYTFKGMLPGTEIRVVDPDTGRQHLWPDGRTPVIFTPSANGDFSVEIPKACGDVRVAFSFTLPAPQPGFQLIEIKVERGANNHPELQGEVPLPRGVVKPAIAGQ